MKNIVYTYIKVTFFVFSLGLFFLPVFTNAQLAPSSSGVSLEASPSTPEPLENVNLSLKSFSVDLNRATISWYVNDELALSGVGQKTFSFRTGNAGEASRIRVTISGVGVSPITKTYTFIPADVDMLWEAVSSYTPPFYKGKALPAEQGLIRTVAVPRFITENGNRLDPSELIYKWKRNYKYRDFNDQSGYGQNTVSFILDFLRSSELVEVEVSSFSGNINAAKGITFTPRDPRIVFYENHPSQGILYERAIDETYNLTEREVSVVAEPYYFSVENPNSLLFEWRLNNEQIPDTENDNSVALRSEEDSSGVSELNLRIKHKTQVLQIAENGFDVRFGENVLDFISPFFNQ